MTELAPIATEEQRQALVTSNRRALAERQSWPAGVLVACELLDVEHPGWHFGWLAANWIRGWERPAGLVAHRPGWTLVGADELRRLPKDCVARTPAVFGPGVYRLRERIAAVEARQAALEAAARRQWESMCAFGSRSARR